MNTICTFILTIMVCFPCLESVAALPLKNQIMSEMEALQANPDTGMSQRLFSKMDCLVVTHERMPTLYGMVSNLAAKLFISVPWILIHMGGDAVSGIGAISLYHNFGIVVIPQALINMVPVSELEAAIAHELNHISHNHPMIRIPLKALAEVLDALADVLGMFPIVNKMQRQYLVAFYALVRYHEVQADLGAVAIIDDPLMLSNFLDICQADAATVTVNEGNYSDPYQSFFLTHPSVEERKEYIAVAARKKAKLLCQS